MIVYLLHFEKPYKHARHYIGFSENSDVEARIEEHRKGRGAKLLQVITRVGISFVVAKIWQGDRKFERKLKNRGGAKRICPICRGNPNEKT